MIPSAFSVANRQYTVELVTKEEMKERVEYYERHSVKTSKADDDDDEEGVAPMGICVPTHAVILLNEDVHDGVEEALMHTFCHEMVHAWLFADGISEHNEEFVDRMGGYVCQWLDTQEE